MLETLDKFYFVPGLCPNLNKCETAGNGSLKDAKVTLWLKALDLTKGCIKILGIHISYNKKFQDNINFCAAVKNIGNVIKLQHMRPLTLEDKITIFKSLAISQIMYLTLSLKLLLKNRMKSGKSSTNQMKNAKLNMVHL